MIYDIYIYVYIIYIYHKFCFCQAPSSCCEKGSLPHRLFCTVLLITTYSKPGHFGFGKQPNLFISMARFSDAFPLVNRFYFWRSCFFSMIFPKDSW